MCHFASYSLLWVESFLSCTSEKAFKNTHKPYAIVLFLQDLTSVTGETFHDLSRLSVSVSLSGQTLGCSSASHSCYGWEHSYPSSASESLSTGMFFPQILCDSFPYFLHLCQTVTFSVNLSWKDQQRLKMNLSFNTFSHSLLYSLISF